MQLSVTWSINKIVPSAHMYSYGVEIHRQHACLNLPILEYNLVGKNMDKLDSYNLFQFYYLCMDYSVCNMMNAGNLCSAFHTFIPI